MKKRKIATIRNLLHSRHSWNTLLALAILPTSYWQLKGKLRFLFSNVSTDPTLFVQYLFITCFTTTWSSAILNYMQTVVKLCSWKEKTAVSITSNIHSCEEMLLHPSTIFALISTFSRVLGDGPVPTARCSQGQLNIFILYFPSLQIPTLTAACFAYYNRIQQCLTLSNCFLTNTILKYLYNNEWVIKHVLDNGSCSPQQQGYQIYLISFIGIYNIPLNCHQRTASKGMRSSWAAYYKGSLYDIH